MQALNEFSNGRFLVRNLSLSALLTYRPIERWQHIAVVFSKDVNIFWNSVRICSSLLSLEAGTSRCKHASPGHLSSSRSSSKTTHLKCGFSPCVYRHHMLVSREIVRLTVVSLSVSGKYGKELPWGQFANSGPQQWGWWVILEPQSREIR